MKATSHVAVAAAKAVNDPSTKDTDRKVAADIVRKLVEIGPGDEICVQTATIFWAGTVAQYTPDWITLVGTTSIVEMGNMQSLDKWAWKTGDPVPGDGVVHIAMQGVMAVVRKGAV